MRDEGGTAPVRLACLTTSAALGGAETSVLTMLTALRRLEPGWDVTVITPGPGPVIERCQELGIHGVAIPYPAALSRLGESGAGQGRGDHARVAARAARTALTLPRYLRTLRRTLRECGVTVIHTNGVKAHVIGAIAKPRGARLVWQLHDYVRSRPLTTSILRRLLHRADAIVANSDSVAADATAAFGGLSRLRRIHNAVDLAVFRPDGAAADLAALSALPPDTGLVRIGLVATLARWKGHEVFIDAIARLAARRAVRAYIIGGAVYATGGSQWTLDELRALAAARGLSRVIGFTGHIDDVASAMRALDVVVHASTEPEPFGMVIAEGMASARAVAAVRRGGAAELFEDEVNALGYVAGDAAELAARLEILVANPGRRAELGAAARQAAVRRFAPERMAAQFREVYLG